MKKVYLILPGLLWLLLRAVLKPLPSQTDYASAVIDQYIKYYCQRNGICTGQQALQTIRRDWPHVYARGFGILESAYEE